MGSGPVVVWCPADMEGKARQGFLKHRAASDEPVLGGLAMPIVSVVLLVGIPPTLSHQAFVGLTGFNFLEFEFHSRFEKPHHDVDGDDVDHE